MVNLGTCPNCSAYCRKIVTKDGEVINEEGSSLGFRNDYQSCLCAYSGSHTDKVKTAKSNERIMSEVNRTIMNDRKLPNIVYKNSYLVKNAKAFRLGDGLGISITFRNSHKWDGDFQMKYEDPIPCKSRDTLEVDFSTGKAKCIVGKLCDE